MAFRKELRPYHEDETVTSREFRDEDRILKMLNTLSNDSIIQVYISYKHKGVYNFLFPLADMDLASFLKAMPRPSPFDTDGAIVKALHGLSSALSDVHEFNSEKLGVEFKGCHHDIKPQNILVKGNLFLLADFGLSRFKSPIEDSRSVSKGIGEYLAPECRGSEKERQLIGRKSDIWSLGCIVAELLAYMNAGADEVQRLRDMRLAEDELWTTYSFHERGKLKGKVESWLDGFSNFQDPSNYSLMTDLVRQMLHEEPSQRPDAKTVQKALSSLYGKFLIDMALQQYRTLIYLNEDPYFVIECEKLRSWSFATGLYQPRGRWTWAVCAINLLGNQTLECLERIVDELRDLSFRTPISNTNTLDDKFTGAAIDDLSKDLSDNRSLHKANENLTALLPLSNRKSMDRFLFRSILGTDENNILRDFDIEFDARTVADTSIRIKSELTLMHQIAEKQEIAGELKNRLPLSAKFKVAKNFHEHSLGTYTSDNKVVEPILVEWRPINSPSQEVSQQLLHRVDTLAGLHNVKSRPPEIRVLESVGFYLDQHRRSFGLLYRFPSSVSAPCRPPMTGNEGPNFLAAWEPRSLYQLILSSPNPHNGGPTLNQRFEIARTITSCILYCHSLHWLHERLNSHNVVFFLSSSASVTEPRSRPFIIGFNHSRQDKMNEFTHGPPSDPALIRYLHPDYAERKHFRRLYDYYSVGLVLLEIGLWRTIESIGAKYEFHDAEGFRREIVERYLPGLLYSMGTIYYSVVKACLVGELGDESAGEEEVGTAFQILVVERLEKCII